MKKEINKRHLNKSIFLIKARRVDLYFCACINKRKLSGEDDRNENQPLPGSPLTFEDTVYTPTSSASGSARPHSPRRSFILRSLFSTCSCIRACVVVYIHTYIHTYSVGRLSSDSRASHHGVVAKCASLV